MNKAFLIIGIVAVIAVIGGVAVAMNNSGNNGGDSSAVDTATSIISKATSVHTEDGIDMTPDSGKIYIVAKTTINNNSGKINNSTQNVKLVNAIDRYSVDKATYYYVGEGAYGTSPTAIDKGKSLTTVYIFQVSEDAVFDSFCVEIQGVVCTTVLA